MAKTIRNLWCDAGAGGLERAWILEHDTAAEGLDLYRVRTSAPSRLELDPEGGHLITVLSGQATFDARDGPLTLHEKTHCFLPEGRLLSLSADFSGVFVSAPDRSQVSGDELLLRDERFLLACMGDRPLRWVLTPQYLSRRAFLHHDRTLLSRAGDPVSWFRTTMFDVSGLPENDAGLSVFRMSYNYRTEPNVCYDVRGDARVRMAHHPYSNQDQSFGPWLSLDADTTYYLDERADGPEVEFSSEGLPLRNKHEVYVRDGHVSLLCLFDPAPTGAEQHRPGAYSDYGPLTEVLGTPIHRAWLEAQERWDRLVGELSLTRARGHEPEGDLAERYRAGVRAQTEYQERRLRVLQEVAPERAQTFAAWMGDRGLS